jgi:hypothetical protein
VFEPSVIAFFNCLRQDTGTNWWLRYESAGIFKQYQVGEELPAFTRYGLSLYWVIQTMMAVG